MHYPRIGDQCMSHGTVAPQAQKHIRSLNTAAGETEHLQAIGCDGSVVIPVPCLTNPTGLEKTLLQMPICCAWWSPRFGPLRHNAEPWLM